MQEVIDKRIENGTWRKHGKAEAEACRFVSREFIVEDTDRSLRAAVDLKWLSSYWDLVVTKAETLESGAAQLRPGDRSIRQ